MPERVMRGSAKSQRMTNVVVIGATGAVGRELCRLYAADGAVVHAVGRNSARLAEIAATTGAQTYRVDLSDVDCAATAATAAALREQQVSLVITAVGGWYVAEPGLQLPMSTWASTIESNLTAHFAAARTFAPILSGERPFYVALNGIASHYPCEGSIAISVAGVGQRMMLDVLAAEGREQATTFAELVVDTPILMPGERWETDELTHSIEQVYTAIRSLVTQNAAAGTVLRAHLG